MSKSDRLDCATFHTVVVLLMGLNVLIKDELAMSAAVDPLLSEDLLRDDDIRNTVDWGDCIFEKRFFIDKLDFYAIW